MKNRYSWLGACLVLLLGISFAVTAKSADTNNAGFTEADKAYYLPEALVLLLRPGIDFTLIDFVIPADLQPEVTFSLTDVDGDPLDLFGDPAHGTVDIRFMLTYIPVGEENKVKLTSGSRDEGGEYTDMGDGVYMYKFATVLPADYETDATYTLASVATQDFRQTEFAAYGLSRYFDNDVYNFVPSGASEPMPRDIVVTETCNNCHNPLGLHGGRYMEVQVCTQCHNPDYLGSEDPAELSYEFSALVHRVHSNNEPKLIEEGVTVHYPAEINDCQVCHTGGIPTADRPLVASPNPAASCDGSGLGMTSIEWADKGPVEIRINSADGRVFAKANGGGSADTGKWVNDGKGFYMVGADGELLAKTNANLSVFGCAGNAPFSYGNPEGTVGALHSNWMTRPSRVDCGSCHTNIDWETGEGHAAGRQEDDEFCSFCHQADSGVEFDRSVKGAHTIVENSTQLDGVFVRVRSVTNTGPGQSPTVNFAVMGKNGPIDPNTMNRMRFKLSGPNEDFDFYASEDAPGKAVANGNDWSYTFATRIPSDAEGSYSLSFEARADGTVNGEPVRDTAENYLFAIAVTDSEADARRMVVDDAKCESCHSNLALHGGNRHNAGQYCQVCHMPGATGETEREGAPAGQEDSIHFKYMVHKIHRGATLDNGYAVGGHVYDEVHFPGDLRDCETCHVDVDPNPNTFRSSAWLPLPEGVLPTESPNTQITEMEPITATCLSCHDSDSAASHALANSSEFGESCNTCHAEGRTYAVSRVHAR
jgi:hypothetical protein